MIYKCKLQAWKIKSYLVRDQKKQTNNKQNKYIQLSYYCASYIYIYIYIYIYYYYFFADNVNKVLMFKTTVCPMVYSCT